MLKRNMLKNGFTLLEMLLVLVIAASLLVMFSQFTQQTFDKQRRDTTVIQIQQILNAALAFYNQNGRWPSVTGATGTSNTFLTLQAGGELIDLFYIPKPTTSAPYNIYSPYATVVYTGWSSNNNVFYAMTAVGSNAKAIAQAKTIAGQLPFGFTTASASWAGSTFTPTACSAGSTCSVGGSVSPPGQNLNNARSVNFASLYKSGQCVPVPACPSSMTAQIFAVPAQVSGNYDQGSSTAYPVTSFTAYASDPAASPSSCTYGLNDTCTNSSITGGANNLYWRVCLSVITDRGTVNPSSSSGTYEQDTENMGSILAITRCVPGSSGTYEPTGSTFGVYY